MNAFEKANEQAVLKNEVTICIDPYHQLPWILAWIIQNVLMHLGFVDQLAAKFIQDFFDWRLLALPNHRDSDAQANAEKIPYNHLI